MRVTSSRSERSPRHVLTGAAWMQRRFFLARDRVRIRFRIRIRARIRARGRGRGRVRARVRIRIRGRTHDPSTHVTSSPEPPVALIGFDDSPSSETLTAEQCNKWHHTTRPRYSPSPPPESVMLKERGKHCSAGRAGFDNVPHESSGSASPPAHCHTGLRRPGTPSRGPFITMSPRFPEDCLSFDTTL